MSMSKAKYALILSFLAAVGPFAIDMYLPALPTIAASFEASIAATQATLTFFFISMGLSQLAYGPLADIIGRKRSLYLGLSLFSFGSFGGAAAPSIEWLVAFSVVQGIGAASIVVLPRAIVRDLHTGIEATKLMSRIVFAVSSASIIAPLIGGVLAPLIGWRSIFLISAIIAIAGLLLTLLLPETGFRQPSSSERVRMVLRQYIRLVKDRQLLGFSIVSGMSNASWFAFLGSSSFVFIHHFHLTPVQYGLAFALSAIGFLGGCQLAGILSERFGTERSLIGAATLCAILSLGFALAVVGGVDSLGALVAVLFLAFLCLGSVIPTTLALALEGQGEFAGAAAALAGMIHMVLGGVVIGVSASFSDGTPLPLVVTIGVCAFGAALVGAVTSRRGALAIQPEPHSA